MPAAAKPKARRKPSATSAARPPATTAARERFEANGKAITRVKKALETTQSDLSAIRGSLQVGGRDLRKDVSRLLRDARRDVEKMNRAVRRDLERLQKDLTPKVAKPRRGSHKPARKPAGARSARRAG